MGEETVVALSVLVMLGSCVVAVVGSSVMVVVGEENVVSLSLLVLLGARVVAVVVPGVELVVTLTLFKLLCG